jgi:hypothetical protein
MSKTHVPAWKRLGLKLKYAHADAQPVRLNGHTEPANDPAPPAKKRRLADHVKGEGPDTEASTNGSVHYAPSPEPRLSKAKKQVSFTHDTKTTDGDTAVSIIPSEAVEEAFPDAKSTKKAKKAKQPTQPSPNKNQSALQYLAQFYKENPTWKFNKNREVWILKHALSDSYIPPSLNIMLAQYLYGIKSDNTRSRLRQEFIGASAGVDNDVRPSEDAVRALVEFPNTTQDDDSVIPKQLAAVARPQLLLWALDPTNASLGPTETPGAVVQSKAIQQEKLQKKRKNRTAVIEYSSSSSSESESESNSESESSSSESD